MRIRILLVTLCLLWPAFASAQLVNDADLGARVVFRTPPPPTPPSMVVAAITEQNSYPFPFTHVFIRFGFAITDATIHLGIPQSGATVAGVSRWNRTVGNLAVTDVPEVVLIAVDSVGGITGRALACVQETERRLVCRGGPQP